MRWLEAKHAERGSRLREPGPGIHARRILLDRLAEVLDTPNHALASSLVPEVPRLQQRFAHLRILRWLGRRASDWSHEPVAALGHRLDEPWALHVVAEQLAQLINRFVDRSIEVDEGATLPERAAQFLPRDDCASSVHEQHQGVKRLLRHAQPLPALTQFPRGPVEFELAERERRRERVTRDHGRAQF